MSSHIPVGRTISEWYDIFVNCNSVDTQWQQYSTVQYTFTHKQYTEEHNETIHSTEHTVQLKYVN